MAVAEDALEIFGGFAGGVGAVEAGNDFFGETHFGVHGMEGARGDFVLQGGDLLRSAVGGEFVVGPHQVVGDGHDFAEHVGGRLGDADVVAEALGHFALAVEADEDGHGENGLAGEAVLALDFAVDEEIEFLLGGTEFDVGFQGDGVVGGEERVEEFVDGDGVAFVETLAEVFAFEHAGETIVRAEADDGFGGELGEPLAVVADFGFGGVEDFEDLREIGFGIGVYLFASERRAGFGNAGGVADHGGEVADEEDGGVAHVLEVF